MNRKSQFIGILGTIIFLFGVIIHVLIADDRYFMVPAHLIVGSIFS